MNVQTSRQKTNSLDENNYRQFYRVGFGTPVGSVVHVHFVGLTHWNLFLRDEGTLSASHGEPNRSRNRNALEKKTIRQMGNYMLMKFVGDDDLLQRHRCEIAHMK